VGYYLFIKWFKANNYKLYTRYRMLIKSPQGNMKISVSIDYVAPEDKSEMIKLIREYNLVPLN